MIRTMYMNRKRANDRVDSLLKVHIEALDVDPNTKRVADALKNVKADLHGMVTEIFDELDAIALQEVEDEAREAGRE